MKKPQWIVAGAALLLTVLLFVLTQPQLFGTHPKKGAAGPPPAAQAVAIDSILHHAKETLPPEQLTRVNFLESSLLRKEAAGEKTHIYHQLARFWSDTGRIFEPYAWYIAEAARLVNSEKNLTFAAHLFLDNLRGEENPALKTWKALQAKDLFERSLRVDPANDSAQVGLGAALLYGGLSQNPMEGIGKIRQVLAKDSANVYAQMTLGQASVFSGQLDRAIERFRLVVKLQPQNLEALLSLADVYERKGDKKEAIGWYRKSLPLIRIPELRNEVEKRMNELNK